MSANNQSTIPGMFNAQLPTWDGPEYARVSPGRYEAVVTRYQGPEWVRRFRRWSLMIEFELLNESKRVCAFFNMGTNPLEPHAGQQSRFFRAWAIANGERPRPKQKLDPRVFLDGQIFNVEVADSDVDIEGQQKDDSLIYSRVTAVASLPSCEKRWVLERFLLGVRLLPTRVYTQIGRALSDSCFLAWHFMI